MERFVDIVFGYIYFHNTNFSPWRYNTKVYISFILSLILYLYLASSYWYSAILFMFSLILLIFSLILFVFSNILYIFNFILLYSVSSYLYLVSSYHYSTSYLICIHSHLVCIQSPFLRSIHKRKRLQNRRFPVITAKFSRIPILKNIAYRKQASEQARL